ncbi:hypothetical protein GQ43DRAFT_428454 [Delitschia confertaspora ATCC 74209]|uniref:C2H2-type domain-containing protein n=1 Tax=Delitschia confertaspora ATCC 74209 TaxID=1513339 RepID=A0A9P4JT32_9PLEO|nr:hypothetical protein GQ43DRAFT_428454 [Delitschia confertaspora ATCC 74209]
MATSYGMANFPHEYSFASPIPPPFLSPPTVSTMTRSASSGSQTSSAPTRTPLDSFYGSSMKRHSNTTIAHQTLPYTYPSVGQQSHSSNATTQPPPVTINGKRVLAFLLEDDTYMCALTSVDPASPHSSNFNSTGNRNTSMGPMQSCNVSGTCTTRSFTRTADFRRHYTQFHVEVQNKTVYWCGVQGCERSLGGNGNGMGDSAERARHFGNRKDKCLEHIKRRHGGIQGGVGFVALREGGP